MNIGRFIIRSPIIIKRKPHYPVVGITNKAENGYLLFMDYDNVDEDVPVNDIKVLQEKFNLGTALIRCSSIAYRKGNGCNVGNFHVIFFVKVKFSQIKEMLEYARCDKHFKVASRYQQKCHVLRLSTKGNKLMPRSYQIIPAETNQVASLSHLIFFEKVDKIELEQWFAKKDSSESVEMINYVT